jgi:hypothetical protein
MSVFDKVTAIYPEDFFSIQNPNSPWVSIQFRTKKPTTGEGANIAYTEQDKYTSNDSEWTEITINPSNFFDKLSIEDAGGFYKLSLTLVDKEFTRLENIVIKSIMAANSVASGSKDTYDEMSIRFDSAELQNLRIRFGYSEAVDGKGNDTFTDDTEFSGSNYSSRTSNSKTVVRSPWIYFMINNLGMALTDFGLQVNIDAFSVEGTILDQVKIMKAFAVYKGKPTIDGIFAFIKNLFQKANKTRTLEVVLKDEPLGPKDKNGFTDVVIELGSNGMIQNLARPTFISLREFLNVFCGKVTPKMFNATGISLEASGELGDNVMTSAYSYIFVKGGETGVDKLIFYYPDPANRSQETMRTYVWREYGKSIVKSFSVESNTNFAVLNGPMPVNDITSGNMTMEVLATRVKKEVDAFPSANIGPIVDKLKEWMNVATGPDDFALVATGVGRTIEQRVYNAFHPFAAGVVAAINDQVFNGTITIPGDPYFLFDDKLAPMEHAIKVIILRPGYINDKGEFSGSSLNKSYLSGYYLIKKITHTVDINGFNTTLDIMRSPLD